MTSIDSRPNRSKQTTTPQHHAEITLDDFAALSRWVTWREERRQNKKGEWYLTKIPYDPNRNQQARIPTDPSTWGTREEAERAWRERYDDGQSRGGVGIVLGDLDDGRLLMGSDLDRCFEDNDDFQPWAVDVLTRINSYAELSPSRSGTKQFFLVAAEDAEAVKQLLGKNTKGEPATRRIFAAAAKHHELAIDRARFYTVTGEQIENLPHTLRTVSIDDIRWFFDKAGPAFLAQHGGKKGDGERRGRDESGSGYGFRFMAERKRAGRATNRPSAPSKPTKVRQASGRGACPTSDNSNGRGRMHQTETRQQIAKTKSSTWCASPTLRCAKSTGCGRWCWHAAR